MAARTCRDCQASIEHRGNTAKRCEACAKQHRREYERLRPRANTGRCAHSPCDRRARGIGGLNKYCAAHAERARTGMDMNAPIRRRCKRPPDGLCTIEWCTKPHRGEGFCSMHLSRSKRGVDMHAPPKTKRPTAACEAPNCLRTALYWGKRGKLCGAHYQRARRGKRMDTPLRPLRRWADIGATYTGPDGYVYVKISHDPTVGSRSKPGWVREHCWRVEQHIGRALLPHENVHHINGDRADNRIENLELWSTSQPSGQRVADKVQFAVDILKEYGPMFGYGVHETRQAPLFTLDTEGLDDEAQSRPAAQAAA